LHGPPAYFTTDWDAARESVRRLAALDPVVIAPGHGQPMAGEQTITALQHMAEQFDAVARPDHGRYVEQPQRG
jgi:glyoxylase-like metal-dependent hydrolase (beta-lactamase superfamily II)